jgi:hypothetical protein
MRIRAHLVGLAGVAGIIGGLAVMPAATALAAADAQVIDLTQVACQFLESENGVDHDFTTAEKADCEAVNEKTGAARLGDAEVLTLKPGTYVFRVTNLDVPYELGFWLREEDYNWKNPLHKLTKISVSGGGLVMGTTQDYEVELESGEYLYSCPLNPTPDYRLVVTE